MLLDDHDAEVSWRDLQKLERDNLPRLDRLKCLVQVRIRVQGPTPQSSMQSEETNIAKGTTDPGVDCFGQ